MTTQNGSGSRAVAQRPPQQAVQRAPSAFSPGTLATVLERCGYSAEQQATLRALINPPGKKQDEVLSDAEIQIGVEVLQARGLDILKKQGYLMKIQGTLAIVPAIDGLRAIAASTGGYGGKDAALYTADGKEWTEVWLGSDPPAAAKMTVYRIVQGQRVGFSNVALFKRFKGFGPGWSKYPEHQLAIVAERHALRQAFPEAMDGLDTEHELPEDQIEEAARNYFWGEASKAGWTHDDVHRRMFGIKPGDSLSDELRKRGMDWRDATGLLTRAIAGHARPVALPAATEAAIRQPNAAAALYGEEQHSDPMDTQRRPPKPIEEASVATAEPGGEAQQLPCWQCGAVLATRELNGEPACETCFTEAQEQAAAAEAATPMPAGMAVPGRAARRFVNITELLKAASAELGLRANQEQTVSEQISALIGTTEWKGAKPEDLGGVWAQLVSACTPTEAQ